MSDPEHHADDSATPPERLRPVRRIWYLLLILPFVATLVPPIYARQEPSINAFASSVDAH